CYNLPGMKKIYSKDILQEMWNIYNRSWKD
ncbi:unnamed protein product, partial [marine sediment metagenome]